MNSVRFSTVAFTVSEIAAIAQAYATLDSVVQKIQQAAPDVWNEVNADFKGARDAWEAAQQIVQASGQLPGMPTGLTDALSAAPPAIDSTEAKNMPEQPGAVYDETGHVQDVTPHPGEG